MLGIYFECSEFCHTGTIASGDSLTLKADQFAVVYDLPACKFAVTEIAATSGIEKYDVAYSSSDGSNILVGDTVETVVKNTYTRQKGNITITKNLAEGSKDDGSDFLFHILDSEGHVVMSVTLKAGETKTIWDLPVGTYTVKEDSAWNWRYVLKTINGNPVAAGLNSTTADLNVNETVAVTFTNEYRENQWLNFFANLLNVFQGS